MSAQALAQQNFLALSSNPYPGRGIVLGQSPDGKSLFQVYWIMGRSENSRNRVFIAEGEHVRTAAFDPAKLVDPSLIIYYPIRATGALHVVSNGDQTDTVWNGLLCGGTFEGSLHTRTYEPDAPNFTPRITGVMDLNPGQPAYRLSILKSFYNTESETQRQFFSYTKAQAGLGHGITTYAGDGNPLPSFAGEPMLLPIHNSISENLKAYWEALNTENRVSLLVKRIDLATGATELEIVNRHS
jgi:IMP cyclohydrolase